MNGTVHIPPSHDIEAGISRLLSRQLPALALLTGLLLVLPASAAGTQDPQQTGELIMIGVLNLEANNVDPGEAKAITDRLRYYLGQQGVFSPIERNKMDSILEEMGFQLSGACDTDECVVQVGKILGASKMVAGSVSKVGTLYSLQIRLIDIESSSIETQAFKDVNGIEEVLQTATLEVARDLAGLDPGAGPAARGNTGQIQVTSTPAGADLLIDGESFGVTPITLQLDAGSHEVVVTKDGYSAHTQPVQVVAGGMIPVNAVLKEVRAGTVSVNSSPDGALVSIDGRERGMTPLSDYRLSEGEHKLEVTMAGFDAYTETVTVAHRREIKIAATLLMSGDATLIIESNFRGARINIDGVRQTMETPSDAVDLRPGSHVVKVSAPGYSSWETTVNLQDGSREKLTAQLKPKSRIGSGMLSLIFPGMGHFSSGRKGMGTLALIGTAAAGGYAFSQISSYSSVRQDYDRLHSDYLRAVTTDVAMNLHHDLEKKHIELSDAQKSAKTAVMIAGGIHLLGVLHSSLFMPRLRSVPTAGPAISLQTGASSGTASLTLRIVF